MLGDGLAFPLPTGSPCGVPGPTAMRPSREELNLGRRHCQGEAAPHGRDGTSGLSSGTPVPTEPGLGTANPPGCTERARAPQHKSCLVGICASSPRPPLPHRAPRSHSSSPEACARRGPGRRWERSPPPCTAAETSGSHRNLVQHSPPVEGFSTPRGPHLSFRSSPRPGNPCDPLGRHCLFVTDCVSIGFLVAALYVRTPVARSLCMPPST